MAQILDGREISKAIRLEIKTQVENMGIKPVLAIVLATKDESAAAYVRIIKQAAEKVGIDARIVDLGENTSQEQLVSHVKKLADDKNIHGIIIQTPVSKNINIDEARSLIPLEKDIDGANPLSAGRLFGGLESFAPATAAAVIEILKYYKIDPGKKQAVVVGRSRVVGKPAAHLLLDLNATVTICHSGTPDLIPFTKNADILVVAAGKIGLIKGRHVSPDTAVIDVGTNFNEQNEMVGDVDFKSVEPIVKAITPVPGGVGPVTTAILLKNTMLAYLKQNQNSS